MEAYHVYICMHICISKPLMNSLMWVSRHEGTRLKIPPPPGSRLQSGPIDMCRENFLLDSWEQKTLVWSHRYVQGELPARLLHGNRRLQSGPRDMWRENFLLDSQEQKNPVWFQRYVQGELPARLLGTEESSLVSEICGGRNSCSTPIGTEDSSLVKDSSLVPEICVGRTSCSTPGNRRLQSGSTDMYRENFLLDFQEHKTLVWFQKQYVWGEFSAWLLGTEYSSLIPEICEDQNPRVPRLTPRNRRLEICVGKLPA